MFGASQLSARFRPDSFFFASAANDPGPGAGTPINLVRRA